VCATGSPVKSCGAVVCKVGSGSSGIFEVVVEHAAETSAAQDCAAHGCGVIGGCSDKLVPRP